MYQPLFISDVQCCQAAFVLSMVILVQGSGLQENDQTQFKELKKILRDINFASWNYHYCYCYLLIVKMMRIRLLQFNLSGY